MIWFIIIIPIWKGYLVGSTICSKHVLQDFRQISASSPVLTFFCPSFSFSLAGPTDFMGYEKRVSLSMSIKSLFMGFTVYLNKNKNGSNILLI